MTIGDAAGSRSIQVYREAGAGGRGSLGSDRQALTSRPDEETVAAIIVGYRDGITVLDLVGEHDLSTAEEVAFNIEEQIARSRGVVVSLTETQFLDSSILRVLFQGDRKMLRIGRRLVLHGGDERVRRVFELAHVSDQLLCCDSLDEAIEFAAQRSA